MKRPTNSPKREASWNKKTMKSPMKKRRPLSKPLPTTNGNVNTQTTALKIILKVSKGKTKLSCFDYEQDTTE